MVEEGNSIHELVNQARREVANSMDQIIVDNIDSLVVAERSNKENLSFWRELISTLFKNIESKYPKNVCEQVYGYIVDRLIHDRMSFMPIYSRDLEYSFIRSRGKLPEDSEWADYLEQNIDYNALFEQMFGKCG